MYVRARIPLRCAITHEVCLAYSRVLRCPTASKKKEEVAVKAGAWGGGGDLLDGLELDVGADAEIK